MKPARIEEIFFKGLMIVSVGFVLLSLIMILGSVIVKGAGAMSLEMIISTPEGGYYLGKGGGILNAIIGSLIITGAASVISFFLSFPVAVYLNIYANRASGFVSGVRLAIDTLWGVPSIVYGSFGFIIMVYLGMRASLLGGIIAVSLLIFPIMCRAIDEVLQMLPRGLMDSACSLGATNFEISFRIIIRQALPGILSAVLLAFGRGIGDAASVLFTAGFSDRIPLALSDPAATLPLAIFFQLGSPFPEVQARAYAAALILTFVILFISILSRLLASRYNRHIIK